MSVLSLVVIGKDEESEEEGYKSDHADDNSQAIDTDQTDTADIKASDTVIAGNDSVSNDGCSADRYNQQTDN